MWKIFRSWSGTIVPSCAPDYIIAQKFPSGKSSNVYMHNRDIFWISPKISSIVQLFQRVVNSFKPQNFASKILKVDKSAHLIDFLP